MRRQVLGVATFVLLALGIGVALAGLPPGGTFTDDDGNTHEGNIEAIAAAGITLGCNPEGTLYCPKSDVTRAQMATFLVRAFGIPRVAGNRFSDVSGTHLANINAIAEAGITLGCSSDGTLYCPNDGVTRAQMASFLRRALDLPPSVINWFTDDDGNTHEDSINRVADAGITRGCGGDEYCPGDHVPRDQMASFLARAGGLDPIIPPPSTTTTTTGATTTTVPAPPDDELRNRIVDLQLDLLWRLELLRRHRQIRLRNRIVDLQLERRLRILGLLRRHRQIRLRNRIVDLQLDLLWRLELLRE